MISSGRGLCRDLLYCLELFYSTLWPSMISPVSMPRVTLQVAESQFGPYFLTVTKYLAPRSLNGTRSYLALGLLFFRSYFGFLRNLLGFLNPCLILGFFFLDSENNVPTEYGIYCLEIVEALSIRRLIFGVSKPKVFFAAVTHFGLNLGPICHNKLLAKGLEVV